MAQKNLGYVKLVWTCPNCNNKNPGDVRVCSSCGSPQPENVKFEEPAQQELIKDQSELEKAKKGPDIHCPYCGARNLADASTCSQCGGDLTGGKKRESGRVIGAFQTSSPTPLKEVTCTNCGTLNPGTASVCTQCGAKLSTSPAPLPAPSQAAVQQTSTPTASGKKGIGRGCAIAAGIGVGLLILVAIIVLIVNLSKKEALSGTVQSVAWVRTIAIEQLMDVTKKDWIDEIPSDKQASNCQEQYFETVNEPVAGAEEVCGTAYTVDQGNGAAEVVQDCEYKVYKDYCEYTAQEWRKVGEVPLQGNDLQPQWPLLSLDNNQREGDRYEDYTIIFAASNKTYEYHTSDPALFARCQPGSEWTLTINAFDQIVDVEPQP